MTVLRWVRSRAGKTTAVAVAAILLVVLGMALPWSTASPTLPAITVSDGTAAVTYPWYVIGNATPDYNFPTVSATANFSETGTGATSNLTTSIESDVATQYSEGPDGFLFVIGSAWITPNLHPTSARLLVMELAGSTVRAGEELVPDAYYFNNTTNPYSIWENASGGFDGPGVTSLIIDFQNESSGPASGPLFHVSFAFQVELFFGIPAAPGGTMTFGFLDELQGLSAPVYTAVTIALPIYR